MAGTRLALLKSALLPSLTLDVFDPVGCVSLRGRLHGLLLRLSSARTSRALLGRARWSGAVCNRSLLRLWPKAFGRAAPHFERSAAADWLRETNLPAHDPNRLRGVCDLLYGPIAERIEHVLG